jgi:hypothetical protein
MFVKLYLFAAGRFCRHSVEEIASQIRRLGSAIYLIKMQSGRELLSAEGPYRMKMWILFRVYAESISCRRRKHI